MAFALVINNEIVEYPVYEGDIKLRYPNTSFSIPFVPPDEFVEVQETPLPSFDRNLEAIVEETPVFINGILSKQWSIEPLPEEVKNKITNNKSLEIRRQRNNLLSSCDWTQLQDAPVDKEAWQEYRQKLRDITLQEGFPFSVEWPQQP